MRFLLKIALIALLGCAARDATPDDLIYSILSCDNQSSVIQINVLNGEPHVVYTPPDSMRVSDITTTDTVTSVYIARADRDRRVFTTDVIKLSKQNRSVDTISYDVHDTDYEFAVSKQGEMLVFASYRNNSTGYYLLDTADGTVAYLAAADAVVGTYPLWSHDSQEVWFVAVESNGWNIMRVDVRNPENRVSQFVSEGAIGTFDIRESDGQIALIGYHLLDVDPDTDKWSGINILSPDGEIVRRTGIRAINLMYHNDDLYYIYRDRDSGIYSISRLDTSSGQSELIFETECELWW